MSYYDYPAWQGSRYKELGWTKIDRNLYRFVDASTQNCIGPYYATKAELLADMDRFARDFGCR